ncbi:MFS transporter [Actinoplanes sp. TBRC 11911]|uniref:CynX/NimT family MFS transporter n=1 Tax=Actinoplanes sp. TBRC 11911 TaxID=2729386 RepID=UPI0020070DB3|nr:MFS transporter [Actinoplanes sp. TBRC 11911]
MPQNKKLGLVALGLLLIAVNLRVGVASVSPVLADIRDQLGLPAEVASLLTTIPVIAFGAFAFLTPALMRRLSLHRLVGVSVLAIAAGIALRWAPGLTSLFAGTVIVGAAIAIANVVLPAAIKHDFSHRAGIMLGLYSTALFAGAAVAAGLTVPLASITGNWRPALALWAIPAVVAFVVWLPSFRRAGRAAAGARAEAGPPFRAMLTDRVALAVTGLMGLQSLGYYTTLTWVPTLLQDHGMSEHMAGWLLSYSAFPGVAAALITPALARRFRPAWLLVAVAVVLTGAAYAGLIAAPVSGAYLWMTLLGLGQGAALSLSLTYIVWRAPDAHHTAHLSTMAQGIGYLLAGLGPIGIGAVHSAAGGWTIPLVVLAALLVPQMIAGVFASRDRHVLQARREGAEAGRHRQPEDGAAEPEGRPVPAVQHDAAHEWSAERGH